MLYQIFPTQVAICNAAFPRRRGGRRRGRWQQMPLTLLSECWHRPAREGGLSPSSSRPFNDSAWGPKTTRRKPLMTNPFISSAAPGKPCSQQPVKERSNVENTDSASNRANPAFHYSRQCPGKRRGAAQSWAFNLALLASSFWNAREHGEGDFFNAIKRRLCTRWKGQFGHLGFQRISRGRRRNLPGEIEAGKF